MSRRRRSGTLPCTALPCAGSRRGLVARDVSAETREASRIGCRASYYVHQPFPLAAAQHLWGHYWGTRFRREKRRALIAAINKRAHYYRDERQYGRPPA